MCVVNDGQREPARAQLVLDRLGQLEHRHAGDDERRHGGHRPLHGHDRAPHRRQLLVRLDAAQLVDEARAGAEARRSRRRGRGSAPSPPRRGRRRRRLAPSPRATRSKIAVPSSVSLTTTTSPSGSSRRSKAANMRGKRNTGSAPGRKNAPVTQPCAYDASPKFGIWRSTPGEVLEVGRRREEERVDALLFHALRQARAARCVVEHHETLSRGSTSRQSRSTPCRSSIPCGVPKSTRSAPASNTASACAATSAGFRRTRSARGRRRRAARPPRRAVRPRRARGCARAAPARRARSDRGRRRRRRTSPPRGGRRRGRGRRPRRRR